MPCDYLELPDGGRAIICSRGSRRTGKCATCGEKGPGLECDKCDAKLCHGCGVSPRNGVDLCPGCARPAFVSWLKGAGASWAAAPRPIRRVEFRRWVRANVPQFLELTQFKMPGAR